MSINDKKRQLAWATLIKDTVQKYDLYGRSFTSGVALFKLASEGWLDEEMETELDFLLGAYVGEDLITEMGNRGLRVWARDLVYLIDLAVLDDIARELEGENDNE